MTQQTQDDKAVPAMPSIWSPIAAALTQATFAYRLQTGAGIEDARTHVIAEYKNWLVQLPTL